MESNAADDRPTLLSPRLRGEPVEGRHAEAMSRVLADGRIFRFLTEDPPSLAELERRYAFLSRGRSPDGAERWLTWILVPRQGSAEPIGFLQATIREPETAHIGYVLHPDHWRRGYAREAVEAMLDVVFERYRVARAVAEMDTRNEASIQLARSLGFQFTGTHAAHPRPVGSHGDPPREHAYELTRTAWTTRAR